jgi:hypothetical protein
MSIAAFDLSSTTATRTATGIVLTIELPAGTSAAAAGRAADILSTYAERLVPGAEAHAVRSSAPTGSTERFRPLEQSTGSDRPQRGTVSPLAPARRDAALRLAAARGATPVSPVSANREGSGQARPLVYRGTGLVLDLTGRSVTIDGEKVELTYKEFELLAHLARHHGQIVTRDDLMESVWSESAGDIGERTIDVHIRRVRTKLDRFRRVVTTVRGQGYRFDPNAEVFFLGA